MSNKAFNKNSSWSKFAEEAIDNPLAVLKFPIKFDQLGNNIVFPDKKIK